MVPDLPELHGAKRTPSVKGKQNSGLALRDRRPLWHPASAGRAHFDTRGQLDRRRAFAQKDPVRVAGASSLQSAVTYSTAVLSRFPATGFEPAP